MNPIGRPSIPYVSESVLVQNHSYATCGACGEEFVLKVFRTYVCLACSSAWTDEEWEIHGVRG